MKVIMSPEPLLEKPEVKTKTLKKRYLIGFIYRFGALLIDALILIIPFTVIRFLTFDDEPITALALYTTFAMMLHGAYHIGFIFVKSATLGRMLASQQVRDFRTGASPTLKQCIIRWLSFSCISTITLGLGHFWVIFDKNKRALHDYFASTVVLSDDSFMPNEEDRLYVPQNIKVRNEMSH